MPSAIATAEMGSRLINQAFTHYMNRAVPRPRRQMETPGCLAQDTPTHDARRVFPSDGRRSTCKAKVMPLNRHGLVKRGLVMACAENFLKRRDSLK
jgi:hypothetical protein